MTITNVRFHFSQTLSSIAVIVLNLSFFYSYGLADTVKIGLSVRATEADLPSTDLGVRVLRPVYATVPVTRDGKTNVTVVMTLWLKRVGAAKGPYDMPHQAQDAIRLVVWVDNPTNLFQRTNGHLLLPTEHAHWSPKLSLETEHPGPVLPINMEPSRRHYRRVWGVGQRPYSYRVDLPAGVGECFKVIEASYPLHKHTICLPPASEGDVCASLAPPDVYTPDKPALYTMIGPVRHPQSSRDWAAHYAEVAGRLVNYVTYHVSIGASGLMLYADELMRRYFARNEQLAQLVHKGHLRLISWELQERSHNDTDGVGRPLGYNYDQGLVGSHNLLGLSSCGANIFVLIGDLDEYIYFPRPGRKWPEPWGRCMGMGGGTSVPEPITIHRLNRFETLTSAVPAANESALWIEPGTLDVRVSADGDSAVQVHSTTPAGATPHPLALYDVVHATPMAKNKGARTPPSLRW
ncbi:hypothetical protein PLESTB_000896300 [Pleodorina starrii]|uniref:Glycosyltransferase family 92 protein n=1 Tax=Pleodorina starrii TaxID=330485 RepID=A0A9W6BMX5_9CHLO|nr:hypothetical protein PLESTB_000896300 [Pleodorina starrii]